MYTIIRKGKEIKTMTVVIYKNNKVQKVFKKYFECFVGHEIQKWTEEHFLGATKKWADLGNKTIYVFY